MDLHCDKTFDCAEIQMDSSWGLLWVLLLRTFQMMPFVKICSHFSWAPTYGWICRVGHVLMSSFNRYCQGFPMLKKSTCVL